MLLFRFQSRIRRSSPELAISLVCVCIAFTVAVSATGGLADELNIQDDQIRITSVSLESKIGLQFDVRDNGHWRTVLSNIAIAKKAPWEKETQSHLEAVDMEVIDGDEVVSNSSVFSNVELNRDGQLILTGQHADRNVQMSVTIDGPGHIKFRVTAVPQANAGPIKLAHLWSHFYFVPDGRSMGYALPLDFAWLPNLHKDASDICGDHFFRSPAVITVGNGLYAAIVPNIDVLTRDRIVAHALDLRNFAHSAAHPYGVPRLSYGLCPWKAKPHVYTEKASPVTVNASQDLEFEFDLFLGADDANTVVTRVNRHLWSTVGHRQFQQPQPQVLPFAEYGRRYAYKHELPRWTSKTTLQNGDGYGINNEFRRGANYHAWENDLHMGFGILHYGQAWQDQELLDIGNGMLRLNLSAPSHQGAFPCVFNFDTQAWEGSLYWTSWPAHPFEGFDAQSMGVTSWWRLYWAENFTDQVDSIQVHDSVIDYANFLSKRQLVSGAIPTYFNAETAPARQLRESAVTAISGAVLAKAARISQSAELQAAAVRAGEFVAREILPTTRFQDFEVFYSCSPKPLHWVDPVNGIPPINNLAIQWAADQFLALYQLTDDKKWLRHGEYSLGILSLFQQVWDPPFYGVHLYGGFGVMNTDGEWNDGRQARFVPTYADYYLATGDIEYLERAVAACRASFALMDMKENHRNGINQITRPEGPGLGYSSENIFHNGPQDATGGWTGYNWGPGGGLGASAYLERKFGSVVIDGKANRAVSIDGFQVTIESRHPDKLVLSAASSLNDLTYPYSEPRTIQLTFHNFDETPVVIVNGQTLGKVASTPLSFEVQ